MFPTVQHPPHEKPRLPLGPRARAILAAALLALVALVAAVVLGRAFYRASVGAAYGRAYFAGARWVHEMTSVSDWPSSLSELKQFGWSPEQEQWYGTLVRVNFMVDREMLKAFASGTPRHDDGKYELLERWEEFGGAPLVLPGSSPPALMKERDFLRAIRWANASALEHVVSIEQSAQAD